MHIGEIIQQKVKEKGMTVAGFAKILNCSRANVYKIYAKYSIDTSVLKHISKILEFDFFKLYSEELNDEKV
ncbi:MAG: helix-turn-helix transcriptional regulator [Bacteroidaceae bacterium]|nr:helix-turn-helix transcriptional regulator [Bacteroidaceae bacterium]